MTDQEKNILIAKACGWTQGTTERMVGKPDKIVNESWAWTPPAGWLYSESRFAVAYLNDRESGILAPPNYATSLEAMAEAENTLTDKQYQIYSAYLDGMFPYGRTIRSKSASAEQRSSAFIKALNS